MKNFIKDYAPGLINIAIIAISLIVMLSGEPGAAIKGEHGWLIVRGIAFVWAAIMGIGTYAKWVNFGAGVKQLVVDVKGIAAAAEEAKGDTGFDWAVSFANKISILAWTAWWIIAVQIMASFYVADWCIGGF